MVRITKNDGNTIYYECDCGAKGQCMIKPLGKNSALVMYLPCALCSQMEKVVLIQYETDEEKEKILNNLNETELSWTLILSNEVNTHDVD
jgi:hypothetical protein